MLLLTVALAMAPSASRASGYLSPAHSQLTYSFTCPSGASGHITYTKDFVISDGSIERNAALRIWVNGNYVHEEPVFAEAVKATNIEQVQASCGIDSTLIVVETFEPSRGEGKEQLRTLIVPVNHAGKVLTADG